MSNPIIIDEVEGMDVEEFYNNIVPLIWIVVRVTFYFKGVYRDFVVFFKPHEEIDENKVLKDACEYFTFKIGDRIDHEKYILEKVKEFKDKVHPYGCHEFMLIKKLS